MNPFYDLNKRLADLSAKQDAAQLAESKQAETVAQSPLTQALNEGQAKRLPGLPITKKDVEKKFGGSMIKMAQAAKDAGFSNARIAQAMDDLKQGKNPNDVAEADYSAKKAAAGKDIGKPGKNFAKIAKSAGKAYGSKAAGERVAGAVLNKLRHAKEDITDEGNAFTGKLAATPKGGNFKLGNKEFKDTSSIEEGDMEESAFQAAIGKKKYGDKGMKALQKAGRDGASEKTMSNIRNKYDKYDESTGQADEGNAFTAALKATPKGGKFKVGNKEFTDTSDLEEGFKEMNAWMASREKEKGTGRFDKKERTLPGGMKATTYTRKPETFDDPETDPEATGGAPKRRGRPKGKDKGPERVTAKSYKYKAGRPTKTKEDLDSDGVLMTRPSNMSSEGVDRGEYDREGDMAKEQMHTIISAAKELHRILRDEENLPEWVQKKITLAQEYIDTARDYMLTQHAERAEEQPIAEKAVSVAQRRAAGIAHAAQKGEIPKKELRGASKEMAQMPKGELKKFAKTKETGLPEKVKEAGKPDFLDLDKDGNKKEPMKKAAKDKKEEKVDETTVSGSVATAPASTKKSAGGMQFGKGVYEGLNNQVEHMITESISVQSKMEECGEGMEPTLTITADGEEAAKLMMLLKLAGLESQVPATCPICGSTPCGCDEIVDENSPDWPTNTETLPAQPELRTYSGGLNGPKSTGQTTVPVVASQLRRQVSMEENVELERSLFKTWKNYKG